MNRIVPDLRPQKPLADVNKMLMDAGCYHAVALVGIRGYYKKTFGDPSKNDINLYDDAIFVCSPDDGRSFNANVDPSKRSPGIATLKPGIWYFKLGLHGLNKPVNLRYEALVQAGPLTVLREGGKDDTGYFGVNIHKGGYETTGSAGCQTIYPPQWGDFIGFVKAQLDKHGQVTVPYLLVENG